MYTCVVILVASRGLILVLARAFEESDAIVTNSSLREG